MRRHTHTVEMFDNSMQATNLFLLWKRHRRIKTNHCFWIRGSFVSISNRKFNSIYSWRCTTTTRRHLIIASMWALLSSIFCSVKSAIVLILLSINVSNRKHGNCQKCVNLSSDCGVCCHHIMWQIPAMSLATSCVACVILFPLRGVFLTLCGLHCITFYANNFLCIALRV